MCTEKKIYLKNFVLCTYFFAIISSFSIFAVILNRSSFHSVSVISTGRFFHRSFFGHSAFFFRCFFSSVVFVISCFFVPCFVQVVSSIRTLFHFIVYCALLLYC